MSDSSEPLENLICCSIQDNSSSVSSIQIGWSNNDSASITKLSRYVVVIDSNSRPNICLCMSLMTSKLQCTNNRWSAILTSSIVSLNIFITELNSLNDNKYSISETATIACLFSHKKSVILRLMASISGIMESGVLFVVIFKQEDLGRSYCSVKYLESWRENTITGRPWEARMPARFSIFCESRESFSRASP